MTKIPLTALSSYLVSIRKLQNRAVRRWAGAFADTAGRVLNPPLQPIYGKIATARKALESSK